jgi:hypothetical protein
MKTTRTYLQECTWCNATGFVKIPNPGFMTSALTGICPVCQGTKVITVTETIEDEPEPTHRKVFMKTSNEYYNLNE